MSKTKWYNIFAIYRRKSYNKIMTNSSIKETEGVPGDASQAGGQGSDENGSATASAPTSQEAPGLADLLNTDEGKAALAAAVQQATEEAQKRAEEAEAAANDTRTEAEKRLAAIEEELAQARADRDDAVHQAHLNDTAAKHNLSTDLLVKTGLRGEALEATAAELAKAIDEATSGKRSDATTAVNRSAASSSATSGKSAIQIAREIQRKRERGK